MLRLNSERFLIRYENFIELFPFKTTKELSEIFQVSESFVARWGFKLGLKKDKTHISKINRLKFLGRVVSDETKDKISRKSKGRKHTQESINKMKNLPRKRGKDSPNWKGGNPWKRYSNPQYKIWRESVLERDNYTCQKCFRKCKKREKGLAAHHIKEYAKFPELRLDINNGITLCRECHMNHHGKNYKVEQIECGCGCGTIINSCDPYGRPRKYVNYHAGRGKSRPQFKDRKLTEEHKKKISEGVLKAKKRNKKNESNI